MRLTLRPSLEATHRSPLDLKAICEPSGEIRAMSAALLVGRVARRWMSSQSMSLPEEPPPAAGFCSGSTWTWYVPCRWPTKPSLLPDWLHDTSPLNVAYRVTLRGAAEPSIG